MTRRQQQIEAIAAEIIDEGLTTEDAKLINAGDGWTVELCYDDHEYVSGINYTRTEGIKLSPAELAEAIEIADSWEKNVDLYTAAFRSPLTDVMKASGLPFIDRDTE